MSFISPTVSLYIFTGLETEEELCSLLGVAPDDAWTMDEESEYFKTDTGEVLYYVGGPHSTGVIYDSPLNGDPEADYEARLKALLDRLEPIVAPLAALRSTHSYPFGQMETVLRFHSVVGPGFRTGLVLDPSGLTRIVALGADVFLDFAFTPFDRREGNRYRLRRRDEDLTSVD